ncbi:DUF4231 domain-containing protein [Streptomyces acidicola]|uniref:DUF4231 domain-containing protein n=1 Tax=Streptomyces acidicola TaxID=2596892 RepID=A0A5N8WS45_9ACTN|nr:DUF4231 domain-containing protein [Streptomyces acidicola]MPY49636.1 DUF4231 domain-containing protein [Streptomyces acidicola]
MTGTSHGTAITAVWDQQSVWSQAAGQLKEQVVRARARALALGVTAAALGTAASQTLTWNEAVGRVLAFAAAVAAGAAPLMGRRGGPDRVSDWIRLRAVSEALKAEVYVCLAGVGAYRGNDSGGDLLRERARGFVADGEDLLRHTIGITAVERRVPDVREVESYVEQRLRLQLQTYYRPRAAYMHRKVRLHERIEFALGGLGAVMAAVAAAWGVEQIAAWIAVAASIGVAVTAHAVAQRYAYQQLEFTRTAQELDRLLERWSAEPQPAPEAADRFVAACEHVISVQNEAWMIRWTVG